MELVATTEFLARSSTLTSVGWIGYIIIGALAGWIAGKIVKGGGSGLPTQLLRRHRGWRLVVHLVHRDPRLGHLVGAGRNGANAQLITAHRRLPAKGRRARRASPR